MNKVTAAMALGVLLTGCATTPMAPVEQSDAAKAFNAPSESHAGLYIYRSGNFGAALKKDLWVDGECVGASAPNVFFYKEVTGGEEHKVSTQSEFGVNNLALTTEAGQNYFIRQYIKMGALVGGSNVELVEDAKGKADVAKLKMAEIGSCTKMSME